MMRSMNSRAPLAGLLVCPQCLSPLVGGGCLSCRTDYPSMAGIPWLMPEPRAAMLEWRGRLHHLLTHYAAEASRQRSALAENPRGAATRLRRNDLPVPALPQIRAQALATRVHAFLLAMIDGERSIRDMARLMEQQQLMMAADAEPAIRRFLARSLADSTRPPAF
jgi:hypothetical protein